MAASRAAKAVAERASSSSRTVRDEQGGAGAAGWAANVSRAGAQKERKRTVRMNDLDGNASLARRPGHVLLVRSVGARAAAGRAWLGGCLPRLLFQRLHRRPARLPPSASSAPRRQACQTWPPAADGARAARQARAPLLRRRPASLHAPAEPRPRQRPRRSRFPPAESTRH